MMSTNFQSYYIVIIVGIPLLIAITLLQMADNPDKM